jgi:hypothetical protein
MSYLRTFLARTANLKSGSQWMESGSSSDHRNSRRTATEVTFAFVVTWDALFRATCGDFQ